MRKIIISFIVAVTLVIGGAFVIVMEADQIKVVSEIVESKSTTTKKRLNENIDCLIFSGNLLDEHGVGTYYLDLVDVQEDTKLGPNDVVIEHNEDFKVNINNIEEEAELSFISDYSYYDLNGHGNSFDELLEAWKTKTKKTKEYDSNFFEIKIKHGSNVKIFIADSEDYANYRARKDMQYFEGQLDA